MSGPSPIRFEVPRTRDLMPLGDHAAHWANYLGELVRELPLHYPSWRQMSPEQQKAGVVAKIGQHLQKIYNGKKAALKDRHWRPDADGTYNLEQIRLGRPSHISEADWDAQVAFWNDLKNLARAAQNKQNRAKSKVVCRQGSRPIAALRDMHMESSATREYPSLIHTFFLTHTIGGEFVNPEDKALYAGVGRILPGQSMVIPPSPPCTHSSDVAMLKKREKTLTKQVNVFMKIFRSDDKFSQMLTQLESQPEYGGGSGSGGCEDDEPGDDEDGGEDEEDADS
ncbi:retrovirus-related pol polyprotein from transposon TNT 1-94 [Tanacetum coccineum]